MIDFKELVDREKQINQNDGTNIVKSKVDLLDFDSLKMYFGEPYKVNDYITINVPTIGDIVEFGESAFWSGITPFTGNTTTYRTFLWDMRIDWNKISDFELFISLVGALTPKSTYLLFGDFNFSQLVPMVYQDTGQIILCEPNTYETVIDEITYVRLTEYIRKMLNQYPKVQFAKGATAKKMLIERDKREQELAKEKNITSSLLPLISAFVNHPGTKYKINELKEVNIVQFMDSINRLQIYEQSTAFLKGMYCGFMDTSKIPKDQLEQSINWLRNLNS